jgi:hypothetical protein
MPPTFRAIRFSPLPKPKAPVRFFCTTLAAVVLNGDGNGNGVA